ncbi:LuxR C-terminal-related transcriptional regulator [Aquipseudomonas guryensis]|uniref:Helix-turn-helix transcriptional regulator n=1 Tax=Aquipseudomonas guryensis TaxID=2759165 RepID=A0A7W4H3W2_9GAMM|nr:LuxR C-terminal-related transcriptional regulator [Pseudomonas guryensis]MBB1518712.1 helix-turn-helix transcriptional regulator [Pseudomonas guryensis]
MPHKVRALHVAPRPALLDVVLPRLPAAHLARPRLAQALLASDCRLTLLCAPAGFGKSVLFNECVRQLPSGTRLVWLDLLGHALSPAELLGRLAAALHLIPGEGAADVELGSLLSRVEQPLWIVLDDYPRQPCAELDACLDRLLERAPHTLRWWINGRRRPAWNLPRLLLQGDLLELDGQALALREEELHGLLQQRQLALPGELSQQLLHNSEGWLAGVCLLLIQGTAQNLPERLAAGSALLQEYIEREVLNGLPEALKRALLVLAHIPRFSAELCAHLLDGEDAAGLLAELHQRQLFLHGLDSCGEWFRLWRPLAAMLRRHSPVPLQAHVRACQWFAARGDVRAAVEHALWAEQPEVAANFLQQYGQEQLLIGQSVAQFLHWRDELPASLFASTPRLITLQAWALIICARLDEVDGCLAQLARFLPQPDAHRQQQWLAQYQAIQGVLQRQRGLRSAREHCLQALAVLAPTAWSQHVLCYQALSQQAMAENDLPAAQQYSQEGLRLAREQGSVLFEALLSVDRIHLLGLLGEGERASEQVEQSLQHLQQAGLQGPVLARLLLLRGSLLAGQGARQQAEAAYAAGLREAEDCTDAYVLFAYQGLALLAAERGDFIRAQQLLRKAERQMQWQHVPAVRYRGVLQMVAGQLSLLQSDAEQAREHFLQVQQRLQADDLLAPSGFYDLPLRSRLALAQAELALGRPLEAIAALRSLLQDSQQQGHRSLVCECRCSLVEALLQAGQDAAAQLEAQSALQDVERQQLLRPLQALHVRQTVWLLRNLPVLAEPHWQARLHPEGTQASARAVETSESLLSKREEAVLGLIAQGCSNQQIAEQLYISLHTVKTHARRINVKLGVERRTQAVARAKALGWMA